MLHTAHKIPQWGEKESPAHVSWMKGKKKQVLQSLWGNPFVCERQIEQKNFWEEHTTPSFPHILICTTRIAKFAVDGVFIYITPSKIECARILGKLPQKFSMSPCL
jgi:hypothetical protein